LHPLMESTMPLKTIASTQKRPGPFIFVSFSFRLGPSRPHLEIFGNWLQAGGTATRVEKLYSSRHSDFVSPNTAALLAGLNLRRHQADVVHVGGPANIYDVGNVGKVHIVVALDEHHALGAVGVNLL